MQFSLRTLLAAVAAIGIGAALWVAEPSWQVGAVDVVFITWLLALPLVLIARSKGDARAWWIGVAVESMFETLVLLISHFSVFSVFTARKDVIDIHIPLASLQFLALSIADAFQSLLLSWAFAPVVGLLCVLTHWLLIRPPQGPTD